jgi:PAS domain S-box-containing protein
VPHSRTDLAGLNVSAENFLAAVLETVAQPIWVVDPAGLIRFANPAAVEALGYDVAHELLGRNSHDTIHYGHTDETACPGLDCPMLLPRATGETVRNDLDWFFRRDGSMFPVSYVSVPIEMPEGRGSVVAFADIEDRLHAEQVLREHDAVLAAREGSLRRIATLVAGGAASAAVFAAIAREVGRVTGLPLVAVWRYEPDGTTATVIGVWGDRPHPFQAGTRWPLDGPGICAQVLKTGRPARIDDFAKLPGTIADAARETGIRGCAGAPIVIDGDVWGVMSADSTDRAPLAEHVESRLGEFTELLATVIANVESRAGLARLADERAALQRIATLVARGALPEDVFAAVVEEVQRVFAVEDVGIARYEFDDTITTVASSERLADSFPVGGRWPLGGKNVSTVVSETARSARIDSYGEASGQLGTATRERALSSVVAAPIVVEGRVWGVMALASTEQSLPADTESRLMNFTELVATAMANIQARTELQRLAEEQAALRRVATLVARGVAPDEVFAAVAAEVGRLLGTGLAGMTRFESNDTVTVLATWSAETDRGTHPLVPGPWPLEGGDLASTIARTGRPVRIDDYHGVPGPIAAFVRDELGVASSVASPILVEGRLWGALFVHAKPIHHPLPRDTESRLTGFTELVATAVSNAEARNELAASRARIVAATDEERRRVVRDLHDGAQARLVHTVITLKLAQQAVQKQGENIPALLSDALENAEQATTELRDLAHGILPEALIKGGLRAAVEALASRMPGRVEIAVSVGPLAAAVEATAYFFIAEALTNVAKHARAGHAAVTARVEGGSLRIQVRDDGVGGARPDGSGLLGLADRLAVLHGRLRVENPADGGSLVAADIPLRD